MQIVYQTTNVNIPVIKDTAGEILAANTARRGWSIQNVGQNPLFIRLGGTASSTVYHFVLKGGSADSDGLGASISQTEGTVFTGSITMAGTSPKAVVLEMAP